MKEEIDSSMIGPAEASLFRSSDQIKEDIQELIGENNAIQQKDFEVIVSDGAVTLRGYVESETARDAATEAVLDVLGVTSVRNELEIRW